jgi:hypothetical protein
MMMKRSAAACAMLLADSGSERVIARVIRAFYGGGVAKFCRRVVVKTGPS